MIEPWRVLSARFAALKMRERALILFAAVLGTALLYDALLVAPLADREKRIARQLAQTRDELAAAQALLKAHSVSDPAAARRAHRDALERELAEIDRKMQGLQRALVPPERMARLLEEVLARSGGLQLVSLRTLPASRYETAPAPKQADAGKEGRGPERAVYRHGFEITLVGSYAGLHDYLARLERLDWQMFWEQISVDAEHYPRLRATLKVQTLSLNRAWLVV
jgi:MSHA biogenesis protein MshJ